GGIRFLRVAWVAILVCLVVAYGYARLQRISTSNALALRLSPQDSVRLYASGHTYGSGDHQLVFFSRYSCPYCREAWEGLVELHRRSPDRVSVRTRHMVDPADSLAYFAAVATVCMEEQGRYYE